MDYKLYIFIVFWRIHETKLAFLRVGFASFVLEFIRILQNLMARRIVLISDVCDFAKAGVYPKFG
jgi:hypothetical protein